MSEFDEGGAVDLRIKELQDKIHKAKDAGADLIAFGQQYHQPRLHINHTFQFLLLLSQVVQQVLPEAQKEIEQYALDLVDGLEKALFNFEQFGATIPTEGA